MDFVETASLLRSSRGSALILAHAVADGRSAGVSPGAVLLRDGEIVAAGEPAAIGRPESVPLVDRPGHVILPALVNAHCHLDLSHLGPVPFEGSFTAWIEGVRRGRATTADAIERSVRRGAGFARAGGTALVGDVAGAGAAAAVRALRASGLRGVSFLEIFGLGRRQPAALDAWHRVRAELALDAGGVRLGLQPHAPYSCGLDVYRAALEAGVPLATHLAETPEELEFVSTATGPLADFVRGLGLWDETIRGHGVHPVDHLAPVLSRRPWLLAHLNCLEDRHLERLAEWDVTVAYCPRASAYFGHPRGGRPPHAYRRLAAAGVNVALGTDGLLCLDTPDRISVLDDMRFLYRRDGGDARALLAMGTTAGARGLGVDPELLTLRPGPTAGLIAVPVERDGATDPLVRVMESDAAPEWVWEG